MPFQKQCFLASIFAAVLTFTTALPAVAEYTYIHNEGEYSIVLPDAPVGKTIWANQKDPIPYLDEPGKFGPLGEVATITRMDPDTGDLFDVEITFLKSDRPFLLGLTEEKVKDYLKDTLKDTKLEAVKMNYSAGSGTLKWGIMTGFSVDKKNTLLYNATHFLTGFETLTVVRVRYTAENKAYAQMYKDLQSSIKFIGK